MNGGPKKKPAPNPQTAPVQTAAAKGYLLRTSSVSNEESDSEVEFEAEPDRA